MFSFTKQPSEETTKAVDFGGCRELQNGEVIQLTEVSVSLDGEPQEGILVDYDIDGSLVKFRVKGGEHGLRYKISVVITTDTGHKREADITMLVREI